MTYITVKYSNLPEQRFGRNEKFWSYELKIEIYIFTFKAGGNSFLSDP